MESRLVRGRIAYDKARADWVNAIQALEQAEARMWDAAAEFCDAKAQVRRLNRRKNGRLRRSA